MKIRVVSDLHLEFYSENMMTEDVVEYLLPSMDSDSSTVLVLAGDMCTLKKRKTFEFFLNIVCPRFKKVLYVYGNHEYYKSNYPTVQSKQYFDGYDNFIVLNDNSLEIDGICFIGSTLWSDCDGENPVSMYHVKAAMNDFRLIRTGPANEPWLKKFSELDMIAAHKKHREFIQTTLEANKNKGIVVITHHAPSFMSVSDEFKGSNLNGGYASDLSELILDNQPLLWLHGHMHRTSDYEIGDTRVVCNPRGYPRKKNSSDRMFSECENVNYDSKLLLTI